MVELTEAVMHDSAVNAGSWRELLGRRYLGTSAVLAGGVALYATNEFLTIALLPSTIKDIGGERLYAWVTTLYLVGSVIAAAAVGRRHPSLDRNLEVASSYRKVDSRWLTDDNVRDGDAILVSGTLGDHGIALLSFREGPALLRAFGRLRNRPDAVLFDGQGIAHPRGFGLAAHLGLILDVPAVGCAKTRLIGSHGEPGPRRGQSSPLVHDGRVVVIDLPQLVDIVSNPNGMALLERDCLNICEWFTRRGRRIDPDELFGQMAAQAFG